MTDRPPDDADVDAGEPIAELARLEEAPDAAFLDRIRRGILRRVAGGQFLEFVVPMVIRFLEAFGALVFGVLGRPENAGGREE